ncbi:hypothetical protein [Amycolatopsis thermoflava]|uniref:hypothetical protein n=1 Tax=Amycolatopsis thermoflava TaxID=84480 RepID=UPI0038056965
MTDEEFRTQVRDRLASAPRPEVLHDDGASVAGQAIFADEAARAGVPCRLDIAGGDAGSGLASLRTRARRDGDHSVGRARTVLGGTSEIRRDVLVGRVLGMPW